MQPIPLDPSQASLACLALGALADVDGERSPHEQQLLDVIAETLGAPSPGPSIPPPAPAALAEAFPDPAHRTLLVQGLIVMAMMDAVVRPEELAWVKEVAAALQVEEPRIRFLEMFSKGQLTWLRGELPLRSEMIQGKFKEAWERSGLMGVIHMATFTTGLVHCKRLLERYEELATWPDGTLGRIYHDHMKAKGYSLPGAPKSFPEVLVVHDLSHILGGFDTDALGECEVIAFIAGYIKADPFWYLFMILLHMHLDVEVFIGDPTARLAGDPRRMAQAFLRGREVNTDLYDHWDFWADLPLPLDEVRRKYNVPPA